MNRSHQSVQDEDLSIFDSEEDLYRDDGVKEEEGLMHDDSYIDEQYTAGPVEVMSFGSVQTTFAFYKEHSRLTSFGVVKKSAKTLAGQIKTWFTAMDEIPPTAILTDKSESIKATIHEVLPNTIHRIQPGSTDLVPKSLLGKVQMGFRISQALLLGWYDVHAKIHGHYTHAIYDFFRLQLQGYYIVKLKGISISIRWMKLRRRDLKNVLKACFKKYMVWEDDMVVPNIPDSDSNTDAIIVKNLRKVRSHGRPQINRNRSSHKVRPRLYDADEDLLGCSKSRKIVLGLSSIRYDDLNAEEQGSKVDVQSDDKNREGNIVVEVVEVAEVEGEKGHKSPT
ncbi:hypothetical protein FXO38_05557 [Capsicum annuum]|nr:hypothetical protein FXO38_05557 [Capsicum annuum]